MYVPMTGEMLDVLEWGECEWPPMMRRLMWQEAAYWKGQAEKLRAENAKLVESRRCWRMEAVGFGGAAKMYKAKAEKWEARHAALVEAAEAVVACGEPPTEDAGNGENCLVCHGPGGYWTGYPVWSYKHTPDCSWAALERLLRQEAADGDA